MKESIVDINDSLYRYGYDSETQKTTYLGPVGSDGLSEGEFHRIVAAGELDDDSIKQVVEIEAQLDDLTRKDVDGVVLKQQGKFINIDDPASTRLKEATWKSQFIDEYVKVNYGYGSRATRYATALKKPIVKGVPLEEGWKRDIEEKLVSTASVRDGSKKHNLIKHLGKEGKTSQTDLKKAKMLPGGQRSSLTIGGWADDGYIVKSKEGKSVFWEIGPLGEKVLERD